MRRPRALCLDFRHLPRYDSRKPAKGGGEVKKRFGRRLCALLLAALAAAACAPPARAEENADRFAGKTLAQAVETFMAENGLDEQNFAVSYYDTVTGETYSFNETKMMTAASTFKLPLNLYYYELQAAGKLSGDDTLPGMHETLDECHEQSLVYSNNEISIAMLYNLGTFRTYKQLMRKYFTMTDGEIGAGYYTDNKYCTRMMLDCLRYLWERQDDFPEMLDYLRQAEPGAYFKRYVTDCEIAHKYGSFDGAENDVGIFYTDEPFLLAVYTQGVVGEEVCAQAGLLFYEYNEEQLRQKQAALDAAAAKGEQARAAAAAEQAASARQAETLAEAAAQSRAAAAVPAQAAPAAADQKQAGQTRQQFPWMAAVLAAAALGTGLVVFGVIAALRGRKREKALAREHDAGVSGT